MGINTLYKHRVATMVADKLNRFNHSDVKAIHEGVTTHILQNAAWQEIGLQLQWSNITLAESICEWLSTQFSREEATTIVWLYRPSEHCDEAIMYKGTWTWEDLRSQCGHKPWEHLSASHYKYTLVSWVTTMFWLYPQKSVRKPLQVHFNLRGKNRNHLTAFPEYLWRECTFQKEDRTFS